MAEVYEHDGYECSECSNLVEGMPDRIEIWECGACGTLYLAEEDAIRCCPDADASEN